MASTTSLSPDPLAKDSTSEGMVNDYEQRRLANIRRNELELRRLGLDLASVTRPAKGIQAPSSATARRRAIPPRSRWSSRLLGVTAPDYSECDSKVVERGSSPKRRRVAGGTESRPNDPRSIKNLEVDLEKLDQNWLGRIIPPQGGQVKRAVMDLASASGSPKFSRMSGIQEWKNAVMLFINVYGDGYKNVFLEGGKQVTWFAQNRQWEGTPVIQRMINAKGGTTSEGEAVAATPICLFCRCLGQGYVYCGQLDYAAHDPDRIPVRFVWELVRYEELKKSESFNALVEDCNNMFASTSDDD